MSAVIVPRGKLGFTDMKRWNVKHSLGISLSSVLISEREHAEDHCRSQLLIYTVFLTEETGEVFFLLADAAKHSCRPGAVYCLLTWSWILTC